MPTPMPSTWLGFAITPWQQYESGLGNPGVADTTYKQRLAYVKDIGAQVVRFDCWTSVNGTGSRLAEMDNMVNEAVSVGGCRGVILLFADRSGGANNFSGGIGGAVSWALNRWGSKILAVEIGNEMNAGNVDPNYSGDTVGTQAASGTPANFAAQMKAAYDAARTANPNVLVLVGGLAAHDTDHDGGGIRPDTFMDGLLNEFNSGRSLGADGNYPFDGVAYHPYEQQNNPTQDPTITSGTQTGGINGYVKIAAKFAQYNVPVSRRVIHVTEFGYQQASESSPFTPWPNYLTNVEGKNGFARKMILAHRAFNQNSTTPGVFCWFTLSGNQSTQVQSWSLGLFSTSDTGANVAGMTRQPLYEDIKAMIDGGPLRVRNGTLRVQTLRGTAGGAIHTITVTATQAQSVTVQAGTGTAHSRFIGVVGQGQSVTVALTAFHKITVNATQPQQASVVAQLVQHGVHEITVTATQSQVVNLSVAQVFVAYQPPVQDLVPPVSLDPQTIAHNRLGYRLFRHYPARSRGVNVYQYEDGTFHQTQPWEGTVWSWDGTTQTVTITPPQHTIAHTFFGGHEEEVTVATADALAAANNGQGQ